MRLRTGAGVGGALLLLAGAAMAQDAAPPAGPSGPDAPALPAPTVFVPQPAASGGAALDALPGGPVDLDALPFSGRAKSEQRTGLRTGTEPAGPLDALPKVEVPGPAPGPFTLASPRAVDAATLQADGRTVRLDGVVALPDPSGGLQRYLRAQGNQVTCDAQGAAYACALPDGTDVALISLANGAARATADAPDTYRQQEAAAQAARRGVWASLPPPPVEVAHPAVRSSAVLASGTSAYPLDGVQGLPGRPAQDMQAYIAAHGDSVTCQQQPGGQTYLCLLPDGTDVAKAALVNGAARIAPGAPDDYRVQQADAAANRRGLWATTAPPLPRVVSPTVVPALVPDAPAYPAPPPGPVAYLGGQPTAVIDGEQAFFLFGGAALGWGYWDRGRHWHGAPDGYARDLERRHPDGRLGGFGHAAYAPGLGQPGRAFAPAPVLAPHAVPAFVQPGPAFARPEFGRPAFAPPPVAQRPFLPPRVAQPGFVRPGGAPGSMRPSGAPGFVPSGGRPMPAFGRPAFVLRPALPAAVPAARPAPSFSGHHR